jgi:hypothetical protein
VVLQRVGPPYRTQPPTATHSQNPSDSQRSNRRTLPIEPGLMPSRYLKLQNLRKGHAADSLVAARELVRGIRPTDPAVPRLYAQRILEADDDWGTRDGRVVQGDGVTWEAIDALFDLAIAGGRAQCRASGRHRSAVPEVPPARCGLGGTTRRADQVAPRARDGRRADSRLAASARRAF